LSGFG